MLHLDMQENNRVAFNEITKSGVQAGMANPHQIDINLVNAQQARRVLIALLDTSSAHFCGERYGVDCLPEGCSLLRFGWW